jgi:hypothetical protein
MIIISQYMIKKIVKPSFLLMAFAMISGQQQSCYAIDPSSRWKVNITNDTRTKVLESYVYFIDNDTSINFVTYYKLYKSGAFYYDQPYFYSHAYVGAIREAENKFYFIKKEENAEILLFDFNLKLGDTIHSIIGKDRIINFVDTLNYGRRRFGSIPQICGGCCPAPVLIEGIGHADGLIEDPSCNHPGFQNNILTCYCENGYAIYQPGKDAYCNCDIVLSTPEIQKKNSSANIFPIPVKDRVTIEYQDTQTDRILIDIYNFQGMKIFTKKVITLNEMRSTSIDLSALKKGMYIFKVSNQGSSLTQKIMKE